MRRRLLLICLAGIFLEALWLATYRLGPLREHTTAFLALIGILFAACLASYLLIHLESRAEIICLLAFALIFRVTLLPAEPFESEDVYRYLWDARVASAGIDPFRYRPDAPELESLRDSKIYPMVNSKHYITAYPPVSQALFRLPHSLFGDRVPPMKAVFSFLEFSALLVAWRLLVRMKRPVQPLFLVAWNPFFIFEFSHSGHSDSGMMFLAVLSFYLLHRTMNGRAMISYVGAILSKLHPALWFPLFLRRAGWKPAVVGLAAGAALTFWYFSLSALDKYLNSLRLYIRLFEFNAGIHYAFCQIGRVVTGQDWDQRTGPYLAAALIIVSVLIWWRFSVREVGDVMHACFWIATADLCLATTVHPWYLSWAAFFLPFLPYGFMFYWTGACFLSYVAYQYRPVFEPGWVILVEYLPMYALMAWEIYRKRPLLESRANTALP